MTWAALLIAGGVVGWCLRDIAAQAMVTQALSTTKKEQDALFDEIKRLRAQVALHIGKDTK